MYLFTNNLGMVLSQLLGMLLGMLLDAVLKSLFLVWFEIAPHGKYEEK